MKQGRKYTGFLVATLGAVLLHQHPALALNRDVCATCTYTTIDQAMTAAQSGDTVRVAGGSYSQGIQFYGAKSLRVEGGYSPDFSERDFELYETSIPMVVVNYYHSGDAAIDGFSVTGSASQGVVAWAPNSTLSVTNCKIYDNASAGILISLLKSFTIVGNKLWNNGSYASIYTTDDTHSQAIVTDNEVWGSNCQYCSGILIYNSFSSDIIARNVVHDSNVGLNVRSTRASEGPLVEWNVSHTNSGDGIQLWGGKPTVRHNLSYNNGGKGMYYSYSAGALIEHNVFYGNARQGLLLGASVRGSPQPIIRHNAFVRNSEGLTIAGNADGWGNTDLRPPTEYNLFFQNTHSELVHSVEYPWGFEDETPGSYGELNGPSWSNYNVKLDPGFVNPDQGNFALRTDSFLIDEGNPASEYQDEPAPNGARLNIGLYGGTEFAEGSAGSPQILNLNAVQDGDDLIISFDTNLAYAAYWLDLEYQKGADFFPVQPAALEGEAISHGQKGARISAGLGRVVRWKNAWSELSLGETASAVRLKISHGSSWSSMNAPLQITCSYAIDQESVEVPSSGGSVVIAVQSNCAWMPKSSVDWVVAEDTPALRDAEMQLYVLANGSRDPRSTIVQVGDKSVAVNQAALSAEDDAYTLIPTHTPTAAPAETPRSTRTPTPRPTFTPTPLQSPGFTTPVPTKAPRVKRPTPTPRPKPTPRKVKKKIRSRRS